MKDEETTRSNLSILRGVGSGTREKDGQIKGGNLSNPKSLSDEENKLGEGYESLG